MGLFFVGLCGWFIGERLEPQALTMLIGLLFGILAGIPAVAMIVSSHIHANRQYKEQQRRTQPKPQEPKIEVHHHHYHGMQTVDQLLEEIEQEEWVRQLSTGTAPKRIATNQYSNSKEY